MGVEVRDRLVRAGAYVDLGTAFERDGALVRPDGEVLASIAVLALPDPAGAVTVRAAVGAFAGHVGRPWAGGGVSATLANGRGAVAADRALYQAKAAGGDCVRAAGS